jgi:hypothetical protein
MENTMLLKALMSLTMILTSVQALAELTVESDRVCNMIPNRAYFRQNLIQPGDTITFSPEADQRILPSISNNPMIGNPMFFRAIYKVVMGTE